MSQAQFRINASRFLLTYPQTTSDVNLLWDFLCSLRIAPTKAIICREAHQDGNEHLHCAVEFPRRINSTRVSIFDFAGRHPNIEPCRTWAACVNYCRKAGALEVAYFGCTAEDCTVVGAAGTVPTADEDGDPYLVAEACSTIREWYTHCLAKGIPFAFANAIWNQLHGPRPPTYFERDAEADAGIISQSTMLSELRWNPEWHTVLLCGASGIGKTSWALREAPLPFLLVTDIDDLGHFDPAVHKSIVFDEIRTTGDVMGKGAWPLTSQIKLVTWDTPVSIRIRYKVAHIPKHIPKIFTSTDFFPVNGDAQIKRRVTAFNFYEFTPTSALWI
uniref:Replication-associated protein n=1 Tax=Cressdnavirus D_HF4_1386 TaxID=3071199 RepID=A0AA50Q9Z5_9VIRU|nr:replication-associated protein [Cressdnavirus D_HF4_1386]